MPQICSPTSAGRSGTTQTGIIGLLAWSARETHHRASEYELETRREVFFKLLRPTTLALLARASAVIPSASMTCPCLYPEEDASDVFGLMLCRRHKQWGQLPHYASTRLQPECLTRVAGACVVNGPYVSPPPRREGIRAEHWALNCSRVARRILLNVLRYCHVSKSSMTPCGRSPTQPLRHRSPSAFAETPISRRPPQTYQLISYPPHHLKNATGALGVRERSLIKLAALREDRPHLVERTER